MLSAYDCAILSEDVYQPGIGQLATSNHWRRDFHRSGNSGFFCSLYTRGQENVIAYRGTQFKDPCDLIADVQLIRQIPTSQSKQALDYYKAFLASGIKITAVTGHSLGGALAKITSLENGIKCIAFNSPYLGTLKGARQICSPLIRNYNSEQDPISRGTKSLLGTWEEGHSIVVKITKPTFVEALNPFYHHTMELLREAMGKNQQYRRDLPQDFGWDFL